MILNNQEHVFTEIKAKLETEYHSTLSTLKKCSYDSDNKIHLCELEDIVYNFDQIKEKYCKQMKYKDMSSVDTLIEVDQKKVVFLVEFKNKTDLPYKDLRAKIHDSLFIMEYGFGVERENFSILELIVVYNPPKKNRKKLEGIRNHFKVRAGEKYDEIEHFKMFKDKYNISSYKFSNEDFLEYLEWSS